MTPKQQSNTSKDTLIFFNTMFDDFCSFGEETDDKTSLNSIRSLIVIHRKY